jgi:hypothetical protein
MPRHQGYSGTRTPLLAFCPVLSKSGTIHVWTLYLKGFQVGRRYAPGRGACRAPRLRRGRTRQGRPRNLGPTPHRSRPHGIRGTPRPGRGQGNSPNSSSARASPRTSSDAAHLRSSTSVARLVGRSRSHPFGCLRFVDIRHSCTDSRESELAVRSLDPGSVLVRRRSKKDLGRKSRPASGASLIQPAD